MGGYLLVLVLQFYLNGRHEASPNEFIAAAEYIVAEGNPNVMLCPRGTTPALDGYRNHPDESISPLLKSKTWAPVVVDPLIALGIQNMLKHARWPLLPMVPTDYALSLILIPRVESEMIQNKQ